ncbi:MAG: helix-turn-helix domain-containing protein [Candidatus Aenigmarchaeota archaeon]|nr:helix-turn-helix domain-containing protein [Candidatus Aenigmarchaeota archaeon]
MTMRKGREVYPEKYEQAVKLHASGMPVKDIAQKLSISYSCAYHWVKGLRKPEEGNVSEFMSLLKTNGPLPIVDVKEKFPKHNELFLISSRRGLPIMRKTLDRKLNDYNTWYFLSGQEQELDKRINQLYDKIKSVKELLK